MHTVGITLRHILFNRPTTTLLFILFFLTVIVSAQENYDKWKHSARIYINTSHSGIYGTLIKKKFPLLVRLNNSNFPLFDSVKTNGADIRFSNKDGSPLPYEIERWLNNSGSNDSAEIWVGVDSIFGNDSSQFILMHWGDVNAKSLSDGSSVFNLSNGYSAVYHLAEEDISGAGTINHYKDATGHHHGADNITSNSDRTGYIGNGHKFGIGDYIPIGTWNPSTSKIILSAWVNWNGSEKYASIIAKSDGFRPNQMYWQLLYSIDSLPGSIAMWNGVKDHTFGAEMFSKKSWHYLTVTSQNGVANGTNLYIDGAFAGSTTLKWGDLTTATIRIGNDENYSNTENSYSWRGYLDEVRIENTTHSLEWINFCYENQKATGQKLLTIKLKPIITGQPQNVSLYANDTATFSVDAIGGNLKWQWYKSSDSIIWNYAPGNSTDSIYNFKTTFSDNNTFYRCDVYNTIGNIKSNTAKLTLSNQFSITKQPVDLNITEGDTARFTIGTSGNDIKYQWYKSEDNLNWSIPPGNSTDSIFQFITTIYDKNTCYRCVVSNSTESITSNSAKLTFVNSLLITKQPVDIIIHIGDTAKFSIEASGNNLQYQWYKSNDNSNWSIAQGNSTNPVFKFTTTTSDNNTFYRCIVSNSIEEVTSNTVKLILTDSLSIIRQPVDATVSIGDTAFFTIKVSNNNIKYQWYKSNDKQNWSIPFGNSTDSTFKFKTLPEDSNTFYHCIISNSFEMMTSNTVTLTLDTLFYFTKHPFPVSAEIGDIVSFCAGTSVTNIKWQWYKSSDGVNWSIPSGITTDSIFSFKASQSDTNTYYKCIISKGVKSITSNVALLTLCKNIIITLHPNDVINSYPGQHVTFSVYADDSTLDYQWEKCTDGTSWIIIPDAQSRTYTFISQAKDNNSKYHCRISSQCNSIVSKYAVYNTNVTDNQNPVNKLSISGMYLPWDTVTFIISNVQTIDWSTIDSVMLWFGLGSDSIPDFSNQKRTIMWNHQNFTSNITDNKSIYKWFDEQFNNDYTTLNGAVSLLGKNKLKSTITKTSFTIGRTKPENPVILKAKTINSNTIQLSWNKLSAIHKLRIYFKAKEPIPYNYSSKLTDLDNINVNVDSTSVHIDRLNQNTRYYFAAQIYKDGIWSEITKSSSANDSTTGADASTINNTIIIQNASFDSSNQILVEWKCSNAEPDLQAGISYITDKNKTGDSTVFQIINITSTTNNSILRFQEAIQFDNDYTILMRMRKTNENWTDVTNNSRKKIHIPPFNWQFVKFNFKTVPDTTLWVNNVIRFITSGVNTNSIKTSSAKIISFNVDTTYLRGFINVGKPFKLTDCESSDSIYIGLNCFSIHENYSINDVKIYRFNGKHFILEPKTKVDMLSPYISIKTNNFTFPFFALIDTMPPSISTTGIIDTIVETEVDLFDYLRISDNSLNAKWYFKCTDGGYSFENGYVSDDMSLVTNDDTVVVCSPKDYISKDNGLRSVLYCEDGRNKTIFNLSRRVRRHQSDETEIDPMIWTPIKVTAELDSTTVAYVLEQTTKKKEPFTYNVNNARLFCWNNDQSNPEYSNKWVEYSPSIENYFKFTSGRLFWLKTKNFTNINFGTGITMSLKDSVKIRLNPVSWTDFAVPFSFDINMDDILSATRSISKSVDSLQFYQWEQDQTTSSYFTSTFFIPSLSTEPNSYLTMNSSEKSGYTVWNPTNGAIDLVFPPLPQTVTNNYLPKGNVTNGWFVKIKAKQIDGSSMGPIFCGFKESASSPVFFPIPPSFGQVSAGVFDEKTGMICAHMIKNKLSNGGCSFNLAFSNKSQIHEKINFGFEILGVFDSESKIALISSNDSTAKIINCKDNVTVDVAPGSTQYINMLVGSKDYIASSAPILAFGKLSLSKIYPNPVRGAVNLRYTLPYATVDRVEFTIFNTLGQVIWHKSIIEKSILAGERTLRWNTTNSSGKKIGSGFYILRMIAYNNSGKPLGMFDKTLSILP